MAGLGDRPALWRRTDHRHHSNERDLPVLRLETDARFRNESVVTAECWASLTLARMANYHPVLRRLTMGFFRSLFRKGKLNVDPRQQALAQAMIASAERNTYASSEAFNILRSNGWSRSEQGNRLAHATSMTKDWRPELFPKVKEIASLLNSSLEERPPWVGGS
jgi:hypothetical protein